MSFYEGQTGTFTLRGEIYRVTPQEYGMEQIVSVRLNDTPLPVNFYANDLVTKFEPDQPKFINGGVYRDPVTGEFWQYVNPREDGSIEPDYFVTFGTDTRYNPTLHERESLELVS